MPDWATYVGEIDLQWANAAQSVLEEADVSSPEPDGDRLGYLGEPWCRREAAFLGRPAFGKLPQERCWVGRDLRGTGCVLLFAFRGPPPRSEATSSRSASLSPATASGSSYGRTCPEINTSRSIRSGASAANVRA